MRFLAILVKMERKETMMMRYELIKLFSKKINQAIMIIAIILSVVFSFFAINTNIYVDKHGVEYNGIFATRKLSNEKNIYKGKLTNEILETIIIDNQKIKQENPTYIPNDVYAKRMQPYEDIRSMINSILKGDGEYDHYAILGLNKEDARNIYKLRQDHIKKAILDYGTTPEKTEFLQTIYDKIKTPFYYEGFDSWSTMVQFATSVGLFLTLLIALPTASIFSDEYTYNADSVYFASKYGRSRAVVKKITTGLLSTTCFYWGCMIILSAVSFIFMGVSGANTPYQVEYSYSIYNMTFLQEYALVLVSGYIASLLSASLSMFIAAKTKSPSISVIAVFIIFVVTPFIQRVLPFKTFFQLTPDQLLNILNVARISNIYQVGNIVFRQIPFVMCSYLLIAILMLLLTYKTYRRV